MVTMTTLQTTPTIIRPDLDEDVNTRLRAIPPYKVVEMNRPIAHTSGNSPSAPTPTITKPDLDEKDFSQIQALRPFRIVVLDCACHSFDDVEIALCKVIPGMSRSKAHQHAFEIHTTGASVVARAPKEQAEMYQERLAGFGLRVTIEPD